MNNKTTETELLKNIKLFDSTEELANDYSIDSFTCACGSREDILAIYSYADSDSDMFINLQTRLCDYEYITDDGIIGRFKKLKWRLITALKILCTGIVYTEGSWTPATLPNDKFPGEKETRRLLKCLNRHIDSNMLRLKK